MHGVEVDKTRAVRWIQPQAVCHGRRWQVKAEDLPRLANYAGCCELVLLAVADGHAPVLGFNRNAEEKLGRKICTCWK